MGQDLQKIYTKKYDLVFSLGEACPCTQAIRGSRLQFASFPFDWVICMDIISRAKELCSGFKNWFNKEDLVFVEKRPYEPKNVYRNIKTNVHFIHDFPSDKTFEESYDEVNSKYERRAKRIISYIENSNRVLICYIQSTNNKNEISDNDLQEVIKIFKERFKNTEFDLLYVFNKPDIEYKKKEIKLIEPENCNGGGYWSIHKVYFNYERNDIKTNPVAVKTKLLRKLLAKVQISNKFVSNKNRFNRFIYKIRLFFNGSLFFN